MDVDKKDGIANIAIVDSGIDTGNKGFNNILGGVCFEYNLKEESVIYSSNYHDENGHGTLCSSVIKKLMPNAGMFIVKILNEDAKTNSRVLIESLKYLLNTNIRLINLSIATVEEDFKHELNEICDLLYKNGKIIICSLDNKSNKSFPAVFQSVIGIRGSNFGFSNDYWYNSNYEIQCVADTTPILVSGLNNTYTMFGGNSKATALFAGIILSILNMAPDISFIELSNMLENNAVKKCWMEENISIDLKIFDEIADRKSDYPQSELDIVQNILVKALNLNAEAVPLLYINKLYHPKIGVNKFNCYNIVKDIERELNIELNYNLISLNTFKSIYSLLDFIFGRDRSV